MAGVRSHGIGLRRNRHRGIISQYVIARGQHDALASIAENVLEVVRCGGREQVEFLIRQHVSSVRWGLHHEHCGRWHRGYIAQLATDFDTIHDGSRLERSKRSGEFRLHFESAPVRSNSADFREIRVN